MTGRRIRAADALATDEYLRRAGHVCQLRQGITGQSTTQHDDGFGTVIAGHNTMFLADARVGEMAYLRAQIERFDVHFAASTGVRGPINERTIPGGGNRTSADSDR